MKRSRSANASGTGPPWRGNLAIMAFAPDGRRLALGGRTDPVVFTLTTFFEDVGIDVGAPVDAVAFDDREERVIVFVRPSAAVDDRTLEIQEWSLATGIEDRERRRVAEADRYAFSADGRYIALARDETRGVPEGGVTLVLAGDRQVGQFPYSGYVDWLWLSYDGEHLAVAEILDGPSPLSNAVAERAVTVWEITSSKEVLRFRFNTRDHEFGTVRRIARGDGAWYLHVADGVSTRGGGTQLTNRYWEMRSGEAISDDDVPEEAAQRWDAESMSADGRFIASGGGRAIHVFQSAGGNAIATIDVEADAVDALRVLFGRRVELSPTGRYVATVADRRVIRVWGLAPEKLIAAAREAVGRTLTADERRSHFEVAAPKPDDG